VTGNKEPAMLTGMTEDDWSIVLDVFDAAQSRSGEPGHNDRKFLEALHFFTVHSVTWRALPAAYGKWNSVWKRFWRISRSGVFEAFFQLLAETSKTAHLVQMFDSTVVRAHVSAAGAKGGQHNQALGRSRGGFSSKIHLKTDFDGLPIAFHLTGGEVGDSTQLKTSLDIGPDITPRAALTDKWYDSAKNRSACRERGIVPIIPYRSNAKNRPKFFPKLLYKTRARVEQAMGKLKRFKRVAMRCEKTAESYAAIVSFACTLILVKSVHRA
jgi:transposase